MALDAFSLQLPGGVPYRQLAADVVRRCVDLAGGSPAEREACGSAVAAAIEDLVGAAPGPIDLAVRPRGVELEITVRAGGRTAVVSHRLSAGAD